MHIYFFKVGRTRTFPYGGSAESTGAFFSQMSTCYAMSNLLLAVSAVGVAVMLIALNYQGLYNYAEYRANTQFYDAIAEAELVFEPRVIEAPVNPPMIKYPFPYPFEFIRAEHHQEDDSVTLTYADPDGIRPEHSQTYQTGQTFVYWCSGDGNNTLMRLYQYRGISMFQGMPSLVLVHFEIDVSENIPCTYPDFLEHTVDIYDASDFDQLYDLRSYKEPDVTSYNYTTYVDPIKHAVIHTPIYVDSLLISVIEDESAIYTREGWIADIEHQVDDSIDITYWDRWGNSTYAYSNNYKPGQTFLIGCTEYEETTLVHFYNYRGTEMLYDGDFPSMIMVNFGAYTRVPVPCTYPDVLIHSIDVFDTSRFDHQYDLEIRRIIADGGFVDVIMQ